MKKLVTFTATWCGPCKMLKPILQSLVDDDLIVWENHDIDAERELAQKMEVKSVPTLFFYENENINFNASGFMSRDKVLKFYGVEDVKQPTVAQIIESSEYFIKEDDMIVETVEVVEEEPYVADDEPNKNLIEDLEADISLLTPPQIAEDFEVIAFDEVYDDEFSDEDLGNDLPQTIDPDDLF